MRVLAELLRLPLQLLLTEGLQERLGIPTLEAERRSHALRHLVGSALDVGCGANRLMRDHRRRGGRGVGCDAHDWAAPDVRADGAALPFHAATFDSVALVACLNHIPDRGRCMREVARVLRPGGRVVITMVPPAIGWVAHTLSWWDRDTHERGIGAGERHGLTGAQVRRLAGDAGLSFIGLERFVARLNTVYLFEKPR